MGSAGLRFLAPAAAHALRSNPAGRNTLMSSSLTPVLDSSLVPLALAVLALVTAPAPAAPAGDLAAADTAAETALARAELADYRGWIKFLRFEAETAVSRHGADSEQAREKIGRLTDWVERISADPRLLGTLRDVQEWAYESPVDGSGQPFKIAIPTDYDPARPAALSVYMHGYSGNHLEHSAGLTSAPGVFQIAVLGRGRGGGYRTLSEADVLHVIDYIQAHWSIDPDRIHLNGGSMGGGGTYRLGSRYPHRWASGRPTCGYASHLPMGNLLSFPLYATHSADDPVVSVLHQRGPLARLRAMGGRAILDETDGLGHAAWDYAEGNARGDAWVNRQVRPDSSTIRRIDYTALDGGAMRGWWGEIVEWGAAPKPARFVLVAGTNNTVHAELTNVARLRLRLAESPLDRSQPLHVAVNGGVPITLAAPLPETAVIARTDAGWEFEAAAPALNVRLHTPGSASLLYNGEPLLIVYGTRGTDAERDAMRTAAEAASKSPSPVWLGDSGEAGPDGVPHLQNLYGRLNTKPDTDVTEEDIARCHLVLIGTATQNSVVERLAVRLPVRFAGGAVACSDGINFRGENQAIGLVHYNPLAPDRLIFWVASDNPAAYRPFSTVTQLVGGGIGLSNAPSAVDLIVTDAEQTILIAARSFDSRWNWTRERENSPVLPDSMKSARQLSAAVAHAIRKAAGADFSLVPRSGDEPAIAVGTTRLSDVAARYFYHPLGVFELTGSRLIELARKLEEPESPIVLIGGADDAAAGVLPDRTYRVTLPTDTAGSLAGFARMAPSPYEHTDLGVGDAVERFLVRND